MKLDYLILKILDHFLLFRLILIILLVCVLPKKLIQCSESPERDCCEPIRKFIPHSEHTPPTSHAPTTVVSTAASIVIGRSGSNIKTAIAILNCILARQLCFEDPSCSAILEIIPRVCGPVPVACSTVTVTKCQAALRTLQAFPFFRPTCLCKEPGIDPDCNYFRDFLFDHPCGFVLKKEKDPYPIDALPTCNHALSVCQQERKCIKLFEDFKLHCKVRDNKCRMEDRELCLESWTNLRLSPMFGCICPNNHMKRRCDRIFSMVNHNPCVDELPITINPNDTNYSFDVIIEQNDFTQNITNKNKIFPSFPYYLYPPSKSIPLALASHRPATTDHFFSNIGTNLEHAPRNNNHNSNHNHNNNNNLHLHHISHDKSKEFLNGKTNRESYGNQIYHDFHSIAREMSNDNSIHLRLMDENMAVVETPLIGPLNSYYAQHQGTAIYPYNITGFQNHIVEHGGGTNGGGGGGVSTKSNSYSIDGDSNSINHINSQEKESMLSNADVVERIPYQNTCHTAMETCRDETSCQSSLQSVLMHCESHRCNRISCMESLQKFYRAAHEDISLDVAFCLCRKTNSRYDTCMIAQEKLHPTCAQRPPENLNTPTSNGVVFHPLPTCQTVADLCKEDSECRLRLEVYEQSCAIDSVTKRCAGKPSSCRSAILGILGTTLRTACSCQGADPQQVYDCLGWQKLLWMNPCVVESQKDFHMKRLAELGLLTTTTTTTTTTTPEPTTVTTTTTTTAATTVAFIRFTAKPQITSTRPTTEPPLPETNDIDQPETLPDTLDSKTLTHTVSNKFEAESSAVLLTSETTTQTETTVSTTTVTTTTAAPTRYCVVQRAHLSDQYIAEGQSQRILLDDTECSELCTCGQGADPLALTCHVLCVPLAPCRTALAYYSHAAPAYQAFRGRCLCYSGRFICMRPPPGEYALPGGIFLLLGYSSTDEALLRPHTNLGVQDAVRALHHYLQQHISNETACALTLFNMTEENVILSARLPLDTKGNPIEHLRREKNQCKPILDKVAHQINSQQKELTGHPLLSIFKMAEVQVVWPEINKSIQQTSVNCSLLIFCLILICVFRLDFHNMFSKYLLCRR